MNSKNVSLPSQRFIQNTQVTSSPSSDSALYPSEPVPSMLVKESHRDIKMASGKFMRVFMFEPNLKEYPNAKWPGVICFTGMSNQDQG